MYSFLTIFLVRLVFSLNCPDILELPEDRKLTLNELQTIPPKEVIDCLPHLGRTEMLADEAEFIWQTIVQFFNGIENIPEKVLVELHYVSVAVPPGDFDNITMDNIDVISNFGLDYRLTDAQLEAIAGRVREDFGAKEPEDYTFYDLVALRQILCAFKRSEIERIHPKAYKEAAGIIGKLKNCNGEIMRGFAQLAIQKNAFGSPSSWTNATVAIVGGVVDFLPNKATTGLRNSQELPRNISIIKNV